MLFQKSAAFDLDTLSKSSTPDGDRGTFSGYASVYNVVDHDLDMVMPGAFPSDIDPRKVKLLRQHKQADLIGVWKSITVDSRGLKVVGELNLDVALGRETYSLMKQGALDQMSVGMHVPRGEYETKEMDIEAPVGGKRKRNIRQIKKAMPFEISLVTIASNPAALITDVKSLDRMWTVREFESLMKGGDKSRAERVEIAREYAALMKRAGLLPTDADLDAEDEAAAIRKAVAEGFAKAKATAWGL